MEIQLVGQWVNMLGSLSVVWLVDPKAASSVPAKVDWMVDLKVELGAHISECIKCIEDVMNRTKNASII